MVVRLRAVKAAAGALFRALPGLTPTFLIVALMGCLLVPLPTALVDLLLSVSLAGSVLLLVASLGIRRTTEFLNFPSLLLMVTLFRLALNVSTTRLILSQADAGKVIDAFAGFVVRGDLIVGGVMFGIITIVQYVVIARGAERVAEVGARFALDGMPGHQAAIEADLRAGVLSAHEAARRRARLADRSNFYGAMDGAVRFVKGDAVAGLAITAINLVGGLSIGALRMDYTWQQSLEVYGRLTVGDGLLAQLPALLVSLAAGVLVARVDRQDPGGGRARPAGAAAWLEPAMLVVPATLLIALAAVPAMPSLAFVTTATALLTLALALSARAPTAGAAEPDTTLERRVEVRLPPETGLDRDALESALAAVRERCRSALGVDVPDIELVAARGVPRDEIEILLDGRLCARAEAPSADDVVVAAFRAVMDQAETLVDLQDLDKAIEDVRATHPVVVQNALSVVDLRDLLAIVRGFLRERIPLPPLRLVLGVIAEGRRFRDAAERPRFPELVRARLAPRWVHAVVEGLERLGPPRWVRLTPDAEDELLDRSTTREDGLTLNLTTAERRRWLAKLRQVADSGDDAARGPIVVVATPRARPVAANLVAAMKPHVAVLSTAELELASAVYEARPLAPP